LTDRERGMTMSALTAQLNPASRSRLLPTAIAAAVLTAAAVGGVGVAAATSIGQVSNPALTATHRMVRLESRGYIAVLCTPAGTLMVNPKTHERVTVTLA
jgi:hypothetical protein